MSRVDSSRIAARKSEDAAKAAGETGRASQRISSCLRRFLSICRRSIGCCGSWSNGSHSTWRIGKDEEVIAAADEANLAMVFTGIRHFRTLISQYWITREVHAISIVFWQKRSYSSPTFQIQNR